MIDWSNVISIKTEWMRFDAICHCNYWSHRKSRKEWIQKYWMTIYKNLILYKCELHLISWIEIKQFRLNNVLIVEFPSNKFLSVMLCQHSTFFSPVNQNEEKLRRFQIRVNWCMFIDQNRLLKLRRYHFFFIFNPSWFCSLVEYFF